MLAAAIHPNLGTFPQPRPHESVYIERAKQDILYAIKVKDARSGQSRWYIEVDTGDAELERGAGRMRSAESNQLPNVVQLRVFDNRFGADQYAAQVAEYQGVPRGQVEVWPLSYDGLMAFAQRHAGTVQKATGGALRVELSEMPEDEHPRTLATLFPSAQA